MPLRIVGYQQQTQPTFVAMPRASAPALVDPTGAALQDIAKELEEYGQKLYQSERTADLNDRVGKATAELSEAELSFAHDQDFRTSPQRFKEQADAIRDKYLDGVTDTAVATAFKKQYGQLALAKSINVRKDAWKKEADYTVSSLDSNLDVYATAAANAKNPAERELVLSQARLAISSTEAGGWITDVDAGKRERALLGKVDEATVIRDLSIDPSMTATKLSLDPTYAQNIDPVQRERWVDQAYRRADTQQRQQDAQAEKDRKARGDELMKDALGKQTDGTLTRAYVEQIKGFIEPTEYKSLLSGLSGADRKDDPSAYAELQGLVYSNPEEAEKRALVLHQQGRIRNETLSSVLSRAHEMGRQQGPRSEYERSRQYITNVIKPSDAVPDPAASARYGIAIREFDDFASSGKRDDKELRAKADEILNRYSMIDMAELARKTAAGARSTPTDQLAAIQQQAEKLIEDRDAKRITLADFNKKMADLNAARKAAEKADLHGQ